MCCDENSLDAHFIYLILRNWCFQPFGVGLALKNFLKLQHFHKDIKSFAQSQPLCFYFAFLMSFRIIVEFCFFYLPVFLWRVQ